MIEQVNWQNFKFAQRYEMVVVGCSAGGIETLTQILKALPKNFFPAITVVQHMAHSNESRLADHFSSLCLLPVFEVEDKQPIQKGHVYFAPTNYHLLISEQKTFHLSIDPPVCFSRPSIDVLFESAADAYETQVIGMVMTGTNQDGAEGLRHIRQKGGLAIVQDPQTAKYPTMPKMALDLANPQLVLTLEEIGFFFNRSQLQ